VGGEWGGGGNSNRVARARATRVRIRVRFDKSMTIELRVVSLSQSTRTRPRYRYNDSSANFGFTPRHTHTHTPTSHKNQKQGARPIKCHNIEDLKQATTMSSAPRAARGPPPPTATPAPATPRALAPPHRPPPTADAASGQRTTAAPRPRSALARAPRPRPRPRPPDHESRIPTSGLFSSLSLSLQPFTIQLAQPSVAGRVGRGPGRGERERVRRSRCVRVCACVGNQPGGLGPNPRRLRTVRAAMEPRQMQQADRRPPRVCLCLDGLACACPIVVRDLTSAGVRSAPCLRRRDGLHRRVAAPADPRLPGHQHARTSSIADRRASGRQAAR
jgi:hypothetical protein